MSYKSQFKRVRRRMMNACSCAISNRQGNPVLGPQAFQVSSPMLSPAAAQAAIQAAVAGRQAAQAPAAAGGAAAGAAVGPVVQVPQASTWAWPVSSSAYASGAAGCSYDPETGTVVCYGQNYPAQLMQYGGTPDAPQAYVSSHILGGARWVPVAT